MSGGSYEYLCHKDAEDVFRAETQLEQMHDRLDGLGYASDAAQATHDVLVEMRTYRDNMNAALEKLQWIWRSVEWWDSGDTGEDGVKLALAEYRKINTPCEHDWQTFGPNERIEGTMDVCMKCGRLGKFTNAVSAAD